MAEHDKKHRMADLGVSKTLGSSKAEEKPRKGPLNPGFMNASPFGLTGSSIKGTTMVSPLQSPVTVSPPPAHSSQPSSGAMSHAGLETESSVIKTNGTYFPVSGLSPTARAAVNAAMAVKAKIDQGGIRTGNSTPVVMNSAQSIIVPAATSNLMDRSSKAIPTAAESDSRPLTMLLQQKGNPTPQLSWSALKMKMHYGMAQNCGRPFCKLKKKDHYHCFDCNQAFSEPVRLRSHVTKHGIKVDKFEKVYQPMLNPTPASSLMAALVTQDQHQPRPEAEQTRKTFSNGPANNTPSADAANLRAVNTDSDENKEEQQCEDVNVSSSLNLNPSTFSSMLNKGTSFSVPDDAVPGVIQSADVNTAMDLSTSHTQPTAQNTAKEMETDDSDTPEAKEPDEDTNVVTGEVTNETHEEAEVAEPSLCDTKDNATVNLKKKQKDSNDRRSGRKRNAPNTNDFVDTVAKQPKIDTTGKPSAQPKSRSSPRTKVIQQTLASKRRVKSRIYSLVAALENNAASLEDQAEDGDVEKVAPNVELEGFVRFPFGVECGVPRCTYRLNGSHWHCKEDSCTFGLTDRSRAAGHAQKHAQVKAMLGNDFEHYRAKSNCNRADCEHALLSAHFHCKKCPYITTITNKVLVRKNLAEMKSSQQDGCRAVKEMAY